jgi:hypothetical protein
VQTANYLEQAKSFLNRNALRIALRAVPLAFVAVTAPHAIAVQNPNALIFNAPNSTSIANSCSGGTSGSLGGTSTNAGLGLQLYGSGSVSYNASGNAPCTLTYTWSGAGSGLFGGATGNVYEQVSPGFTITPGAHVFVTGWNLSVFINGSSAGQFSCTTSLYNPFQLSLRGLAPRGSGGTDCALPANPSGTFAVPASLSTWRVVLAVTATWNFGDGAELLTVNVPAAGSIDLLAQQGSPVVPNVPALTPLAFGMTAILLLSLAGVGILRRKSAGGGFPGQPS